MLRRDAGQILPGLIMLMLAILALGAMAFQIGKAAVLRSGAQTAADAAALAGARSVRDQLAQQVASTGTSSFAAIDQAVVRAAAADYARRNGARLTELKVEGADVRAFVDTEDHVDDTDRKGQARARARVELVIPTGLGATSGGGGAVGSFKKITDEEWKKLAKELNKPPGCDDVVKLGRFLQEHGGQIIENAALGDPPMPGDHEPNGFHYKCGGSGAIDVNYDSTGNEKAIIDSQLEWYDKLGFRTIWQVAGHFNHAHVDFGNTPSISGGAGGAAGPLQDTLLEVRLVDWDAPSPTGLASGFLGGAGGIPYGPPDPQVAATMCDVLDRMHASAKVRLAAWETAIVESGVKNLSFGDAHSHGVFQQQWDQGWGTLAQTMDPEHATAEFVRRAKRIERSYADPGDLSQAVQGSAHPERYAQRAGQAAALDQKFCR